MSRDYEDGDGAVVKRQKLTNGNALGRRPASRIFAPFRVSDDGSGHMTSAKLYVE